MSNTAVGTQIARTQYGFMSKSVRFRMDLDSGTDPVSIALRPHELNLKPVSCIGGSISQQSTGTTVDCYRDIQSAVTIEIGSCAASLDLFPVEKRSGIVADVTKVDSAIITKDTAALGK